jgi:hypothetical protein
LRTYAEFRSYLVDFVNGLYPFLLFVGRPGLGKTEHIREAIRGRDACYRKAGQLTPLQFYIDCYRHRGQPIILDDAEHLLENKVGAKLISALGDTTPAKLLCYASTSRALGDVPQGYYTTSSLCVLANRTTKHEDLQSRAVVGYLSPTNLEIHQDAAGWFWDQEIHDWFGQHLYRLPPLDTRWYVIADRDKRAGRDWRQIILKTHVPSPACCLVQDLEGDPAYPTRQDRARRFTELMGAAKPNSRATYFRLVGRLEEEGRLVVETVPPILLRLTRPPGTPSLLELESLEASRLYQPEEEPRPLDLPEREQFAQPVRGQAPPEPPPQPVVLDDSVAWERQQERDEDDEA